MLTILKEYLKLKSLLEVGLDLFILSEKSKSKFQNSYFSNYHLGHVNFKFIFSSDHGC